MTKTSWGEKLEVAAKHTNSPGLALVSSLQARSAPGVALVVVWCFAVNHIEKRTREYGMRKFREKGFNLVIKVLVQTAWSAWISVVVTTNILDALHTAGLLLPGVAFSGNFQLIVSTTAVYHTPVAIDWVLFLGVIVWEGVFALLFWRSVVALWKKGSRNNPAVQLAYVVALPLWPVFLFFDEVFLNYPIEGTHLHIFIGLLVTFLLIQLVPDLDPSA